MYKILTIDNRKGANWYKPVTDWTGLKAQGYAGAYILAHQVIKGTTGYVIQDNLFLSDIFDEAQNNGFRVGFYILPDGINISYAKTFQDLAFKRTAFGSSLLPAVVIGQWPANYKVSQVEGDFIPYFNDILVKPLGDVVLGLNQSTASLLVNSKSSPIMTTLSLPGVRIWYIRPGITATVMDAEFYATPAKKRVWIAGITLTESWADWVTPIPPVSSVSSSPSSSPSPSTPIPPPVVDVKQQIAEHLRAIADLILKL